MKYGRNDSCWCGSGKKYKKCHLGRESQESIPTWSAQKEFKKAFSKQVCSAPECWRDACDGKIVKAHTVPKSSLKSIARAGHVYGLRPSLDSLSENEGEIVPELIGVNQATTFTGFCGYHDNSIFSPLEKRCFKGTAEQCCLLLYRAHVRECYTKAAALSMSGLMGNLDRGHDLDEQMRIQSQVFLGEVGYTAAIKDNEHHRLVHEKCVLNNDFSDIRALLFKFDRPPPVMVSGATNPLIDFEGNMLQDLGDLEKIPDLISMTSFFDGTNGWMVFVWSKSSHRTCQKFAETLLRKKYNEIGGILIQYAIKDFENVAISPDWWESLENETRGQLMALFYDYVNPFIEFNDEGLNKSFLGSQAPVPASIKLGCRRIAVSKAMPFGLSL